MSIDKNRSRGFMHSRALVVLAILASAVFPCHADPYKRWDFDKHHDWEGWSAPQDAVGAVMGGSLWLAFTFKEKDPGRIASAVAQDFGPDFIFGNSPENADIQSPKGLDLSTPSSSSRQLQVRMRVLNLSPVTDVFLRWKSKSDADGYPNSRRCALRADLKVWQEITCGVSKGWAGRIDQIALGLDPFPIRGDLWIDYIEIVEGIPEKDPQRPDVASKKAIPRIVVPGLSQAGFSDAFTVLDQALMVDVPAYGFNYPIMSPGGLYHGNWWLMDAVAGVAAAKWANQSFADNAMRGFRDVQAANPDGRLPRAGWATTRGQVSDFSMLSGFFEVADDVARRTTDLTLRREIYESLRLYLDWWLSPVKRDPVTGLISGSQEETFGEDETMANFLSDHALQPQTLAPVDLNVELAVGAKRTADLATLLDRPQDARKYQQAFSALSRAINTYMWDERDGVYYNYNLRLGQRHHRMLVTVFDPLRLAIAPPARRDRLIKRLLDPTQFNWGKRPLTSASMTDPDFTEPTDTFEFNGWIGGIWTVRNLQVIAGLRDSGRPDLAAELNWETILEFHQKYREYLIPSTGNGGGAERYTLSASHYIQAIIETLFGVNFDGSMGRLSIIPHLPTILYGHEITLDNLALPSKGDTRLSLRIDQSSPGVGNIRVNITGPLPKGTLEIALPGSGKKILVPAAHSITAVFP